MGDFSSEQWATISRNRGRHDLGIRTATAARVDFCDFEARNLGLIEGPHRIADDDVRERMLEPSSDQQQVDLDVICWRHAATQAGNQARAIRVALWDGGDIGYRASAPVGGFVDDRLVAAPLRDLAGLPW